MVELSEISKEFTVRKIEEKDIEEALKLYQGNPMYFEYCPPEPSYETVYGDMIALPPRTNPKAKFFCGYYKNDELIAILDLIEKYPDKERCFIGFFMVKKELQGEGLGTKIVTELFEYLKSLGYKYVRLGHAYGNPQADHFWKKNGFVDTGHIADALQYKIVMAEKEL